MKTESKSYSSWAAMMQRCYNPNDSHFNLYGGRGIAVCDRWQESENFVEDMGERPVGHSIERIDNDQGYSPENCKWIPMGMQQRNTRKTKLTMVAAREIRMLSKRGYSQRELAKEFGVSPGSIQQVLENRTWKA